MKVLDIDTETGAEGGLQKAARKATGSPRMLVLTALNKRGCAVSDFTRRLFDGLMRRQDDSAEEFVLSPRKGQWREYMAALKHNDVVLCNFPVVDWKPLLFAPIIAFALARLRGRKTVLVLHEWAALNPLRRLTYVPVLLLSSRIVMMSALVRSELAAVPVLGRLARSVRLVPLPPNLAKPAQTEGSDLRDQLVQARSEGRMLIAQFGAIYPGKQPKALLEVLQVLKKRGETPLLVLIGSFIKDIVNSEADFWNTVESYGLKDDLLVTGYVETITQLYGLFEEVEVFVYPFEEGMTARRSSVLATSQAGRPIITTEPKESNEFDAHPRLQTLIEEGALHFVPIGASPDQLADAVLAVRQQEDRPVDVDLEAWWDETAAGISEAL